MAFVNGLSNINVHGGQIFSPLAIVVLFLIFSFIYYVRAILCVNVFARFVRRGRHLRRNRANFPDVRSYFKQSKPTNQIYAMDTE